MARMTGVAGGLSTWNKWPSPPFVWLYQRTSTPSKSLCLSPVLIRLTLQRTGRSGQVPKDGRTGHGVKRLHGQPELRMPVQRSSAQPIGHVRSLGRTKLNRLSIECLMLQETLDP
eukprot:5691700-Amphidinium_carterae.1